MQELPAETLLELHRTYETALAELRATADAGLESFATYVGHFPIDDGRRTDEPMKVGRPYGSGGLGSLAASRCSPSTLFCPRRDRRHAVLLTCYQTERN
jgi:hypothetical protein